MNTINFTKFIAAGNDFVVVEAKGLKPEISNLPDLAKNICDRKYGIGADGLLVLDESNRADVRMRVFNPDGSEADMCGNGARCCAKYYYMKLAPVVTQAINIETKAGTIEASVEDDLVRLKMYLPGSIKLNIKMIAHGAPFTIHYINTGVPHSVIFVKDIEATDVAKLGKEIRNSKEFAPDGANVNFVKVLGKNNIAVRTYERGVEAETLACGTGAVASALIYAIEANVNEAGSVVNVQTKSGEILNVCFRRKWNNFKDVFLEGSAKIVYFGRMEL